MVDVQEQAELKGKNSSEAQSQARKMLRRLMAERNIRTTQMGIVLGEEAHTVRRALNGSRSITLDEAVRIAKLGGYSLDEHLLGGAPTGVKTSSSGEPLENSLSRVFAAIADLLANGAGGSAAPRKFEPLESVDIPAKPDGRKSQQADSETPRRGRGRPRKTPLPVEDLPGPQW